MTLNSGITPSSQSASYGSPVMKWLLVALAALALPPAAAAQYAPAQPLGNTEARLIHYIAHDGARRTAWLLLPITLTRHPIPLVISPHGRGVGANANAL